MAKASRHALQSRHTECSSQQRFMTPVATMELYHPQQYKFRPEDE